MLAAEVKKLGGTKAAAKKLNISESFLSNIMACRDIPTKSLCAYFGLRPVRDIKYRYEPLQVVKK